MKNKGSREGSEGCCDYAAALCPASSRALSAEQVSAWGMQSINRTKPRELPEQLPCVLATVREICFPAAFAGLS